MANNKTELALDVLRELGQITSDEDADNDHSAYVIRRYERRLTFLRKRGWAHWDADDIPDEIYDPLVRHIADICKKHFGETYDAEGALQEIIAATAEPYRGEPMTSQRF